MCHNHSHAKAHLIGTVILAKEAHAIWQCDQDFTIETLDGGKLIRPAGSIFLTPFLTQADWSAFLALLTAEHFGFLLPLAPGAPPNMATPVNNYSVLLSALQTG